MVIEIADPLHALSLARTALSDPMGLPLGEDLDDVADYAVAKLDQAIDGLYFEPCHDPTREASLVLFNLEHLLSSLVDGLDENGGAGQAVAHLLAAGAHLHEARVIVSADRS